MKTSIRWMIVPAFLACCAVGTLGCEAEEGPMEQTGEKLDEAADAVDETAQDAKRKVEDAMD